MRYLIIPTIFSKNKKEFKDKFIKLGKISKNLQIDFMDGRFVKEKSIKLKDIPNLKKYNINFEAHLMLKNPEKHILKLKAKGFKKIIFHYSALKNKEEIKSLINKIKKAQMKAFIAVNPEVKFKDILGVLNLVDGVMFMGVHPGKEHQRLIVGVLINIKKLRKLLRGIDIQIDGGVNKKNIKKITKSGVNIINSGSYILEAENPKLALKELNQAFKSVKR